jgi:predicted ATPase
MPVHNFPVQLTPFIGRAEEVSEIVHLLADSECRLLTLVGPGGIGKTRLALVVAADVAARFGGTWYADLVPVTDPALLFDAAPRKRWRPTIHRMQLMGRSTHA